MKTFRPMSCVSTQWISNLSETLSLSGTDVMSVAVIHCIRFVVTEAETISEREADRLQENLPNLIPLELTFLSKRLHSTKHLTLRHKWTSTNSLAYSKHPDFTAITTLPEFKFVNLTSISLILLSFGQQHFQVWFLLVYGIWFQSNTWNLLWTHKITRDVRISTA
jgi:hypothetical protein